MYVYIYATVMQGHMHKLIIVLGSQEFIHYLSSESLPTAEVYNFSSQTENT